MNFRKYFDLIVLVILLEIICNSSADDWKKLKRKLIALTLLHSIRVKTIVPLPIPLPLPIVVKKHVTPVVLPPKRVPFLVPKPMPFYQIIPNFVPIYSKDTDSHEKKWSSEENLEPAQQLTHEDYLIPPEDHSGLDNDYYKLTASEVPHSETVHNFEFPQKFNRHKFHHDQFIDPFELNAKHKFPKYSRKFRKQVSKPFDPLKQLYIKDDNQEKYDDLLMVSSALKTEPQDNRPNINPYANEKPHTTDHYFHNHRFSTIGQLFGHQMHKQISDFKPNEEILKENLSKDKQTQEKDLPGVKTTTKKIKVGEIRIHSKQLKALLEHHKKNSD